MGNIKDLSLMLLANGVYAEVITEDQAIDVMTAMDDSAEGAPEELAAKAKALTPIMQSLVLRYAKETRK